MIKDEKEVPPDTKEAVTKFMEYIYENAEANGIKIISDDSCCRLLAWLYIYGGWNEATVVNTRLNWDIRYAQKRLNIFGGEQLNLELIPVLQKYIKEITGENEHDYWLTAQDKRNNNRPDWVRELEKKYKLKHVE
jgi:hypothetical protein